MKTSTMRMLLAVCAALFQTANARPGIGPAVFAWEPTVSAPRSFPVQLLLAQLQLPDGRTVPLLPKALIANGWGEIGAVSLLGESRKPAPVQLEVTWFSYVERKTYGGRFVLDAERFAQIYAQSLVRPATGTNGEFTHLVIGLAPMGGVSVWLTGDGLTQLLGHFRAPAVQFDMSQSTAQYGGSADAYASDVIARNLPPGQVRMRDVPAQDLEKWSGVFRRQRLWRWNTVPAPSTGVLVAFLNGETRFWPQPPAPEQVLELPVPRSMNLRWKTPAGHAAIADVTFDEGELLAALWRLDAAGDGVVTLDVELSERPARVTVKSGQTKIVLEKTQVERYAVQ